MDWEEATSLLPMADFFLMGDLRDAAIPVIENLLSLEHLLEAAELAVKQSNEKLKEVCCDFALSRIPPGDHSNDLLQKLILILPMFGLRAWHRSYVATKVLGVEQRSPLKSRKDFLDSSYPDYIREHLKPNMLVVCNQESDWQGTTVPVGSVGRVIKLVMVRAFAGIAGIKALVKWSRLGKARAGKVNFCTSSTFHLQLDLLVDLRSMGTACHNAMRRLTALRRQSCLKKNLQEKLAFYFVTANSIYIINFSSFIHTSTIGSAFFD